MNLLERARRKREILLQGKVWKWEITKRNEADRATKALSEFLEEKVTRSELTKYWHEGYEEKDYLPYMYSVTRDGVTIGYMWEKRGYDNLGAQYENYFYLVIPREPEKGPRGYTDTRPYRLEEVRDQIDLLNKVERYITNV